MSVGHIRHYIIRRQQSLQRSGEMENVRLNQTRLLTYSGI